MRASRGLIIVFRDESAQDFKDISKRLTKLDPTIKVLGFGNKIDSSKIPRGFFEIPHLVIYLVNPPPVNFEHYSPKLAVKYLDKVQENLLLKEKSINYLALENFNWGMTLDREIFGDWVVIKPANKTSTGRDINLIRRDEIPILKLNDFPSDHLIHQDEYLVQKFIYCGDRPTHFRVTIFLGKILFSSRAISRNSYPSKNSSLQERLRTSIASNFREYRTTELYIDIEVNQFALSVAKNFQDLPLLGIDILRNNDNQKLYVLELNSGGNTWHFSSESGKGYRFDLGGRNLMIKQYDAWDQAAMALLEKISTIS